MLLPILALGCSSLPPLGEVLLAVDTNLPVPRIVNQLRVDLYSLDGTTWIGSREVPALEPSAWPVSFAVNLGASAGARSVLVRLRAYPAGLVRDYRGERFSPRAAPPALASQPAPIAPVPEGETPRLLAADGTDVTPPSEPNPWVTVDRLVRVDVTPGVAASAHVLLDGACAGTMADLASGTTCVGTENALDPIAPVALDPQLALPQTTVEGAFGATVPCTASARPGTTLPDGTELFDEEVCVPGRAFVFGTPYGFGYGTTSDVPERIVRLPPFRIDRYEVTVARWRDALAKGLHATNGGPTVNDGPLDQTTAATGCTWSDAPMGREALPLNCVDLADARALCTFLGGDLPTEAEWEYVALDVGRDSATQYPWGNEVPTCAQAVYGRRVEAQCAGMGEPLLCACNTAGTGPIAVAAPTGDVALATGVADLAGNLVELVRDSAASFASACWAAQPLDSPSCQDPSVTAIDIRGGSWADSASALPAYLRLFASGTSRGTDQGFRCVREGP